MAIEDILTALDIQADSEINQIHAQLQTRADEILSEARKKADAAADVYVTDAVKTERVAAEQELHKGDSAYRRRVADVKREVFEEVFTQASEKIGGIRQTPEYPVILGQLITDATSDLKGDYVVHVDPADQALVAGICPGVTCLADIKTVGGVVVTSADGRIQRSSTFEDRLQRVHEKYGEMISEVLAL